MQRDLQGLRPFRPLIHRVKSQRVGSKMTKRTRRNLIVILIISLPCYIGLCFFAWAAINVNYEGGLLHGGFLSKEHSKFLFDKLKEGEINLIGTDHAPHTLEEKNREFLQSPSGFPGFETYPLLLLNKIFNFQLSMESFIKAASENPAKIFKLHKKGKIKEGYYADLLVIDKITDYKINPLLFITKAKFTPYENFVSNVQIWKVFLHGKEINILRLGKK